jgi:LPS-assembly protein
LASLASLIIALSCHATFAQQTNPVDRKVTNPMTDTPNVNPLNPDQSTQSPARRTGAVQGVAMDEISIGATKEGVSGPANARVAVYEGNVDVRIGTYRLQADKVTVYEAENRVVAEGSVVFDQADQQRITGARSEWNYRTKTGYFIDATGYTNQTQDGTRIYFIADRVEKISLDTIVATNVTVTACDEDIPKWSFHAKKARIKTGDRVRIYSPQVKIKKIPVFYLPFASISIKQRDRASGFLTPTLGGSGSKGFRLSSAYYQTLGRSADFTFRNDIYTSRGIGLGGDLRTRGNSRSFLNVGFYAVKDRIFGPKADAEHPDQGGSSFYVEGVHYFKNGFTAASDVNITSNLAFRQVFSDNIQQAISPEETSQVFVNKDHNEYSFNNPEYYYVKGTVPSDFDQRNRLLRRYPQINNNLLARRAPVRAGVWAAMPGSRTPFNGRTDRRCGRCWQRRPMSTHASLMAPRRFTGPLTPTTPRPQRCSSAPGQTSTSRTTTVCRRSPSRRDRETRTFSAS